MTYSSFRYETARLHPPHTHTPSTPRWHPKVCFGDTARPQNLICRVGGRSVQVLRARRRAYELDQFTGGSCIVPQSAERLLKQVPPSVVGFGAMGGLFGEVDGGL